MKRILGGVCGLATFLFLFSSADNVQAAAFGSGNLVVVVDGDGTAALTGNATAGFLYEFNTTLANQASPIQIISLPTAASGVNQALTFSGTASSEGFLTLSTDARYLTVAGYAATPGTTTPQTSAASAVARVVARIDMNGSIDTSTVLGDAYSGSNIRSVVSTDGINLWTAGNGGSGLGSTAGVRSTTLGSSTSTLLNSTASNMRVDNIYNGQLYVSSSTSSGGGLFGVSTVGVGLPTSAIAGNTPIALPGMPTSGTHSAYDFWFKDASTLYIADDGTAANGGGIQKWLFDGSTWTLSYTLLNDGTTTTGVRGLAGTVDANGNAVLFGTTAVSSGNNLITITDTGAGSVSTVLATAPLNTAFRGVEFIPEPSAAALTGLGLLALILRRQRR